MIRVEENPTRINVSLKTAYLCFIPLRGYELADFLAFLAPGTLTRAYYSSSLELLIQNCLLCTIS